MLRFIYSTKKRKEVLRRLKKNSLAAHTNVLYTLFNMFGKGEQMSFYELIKEAQKKLLAEKKADDEKKT